MDFKEMCEEYGGSYEKEKYLGKEAEVCNFENFDDYEAFIIWLDKQSVKDDKFYIARFDFKENGYDYRSQFEVYKGGKELSYATEKVLMSVDMLSSVLEEKGKEEVDIDKVIDRTIEKMEEEVEKVEPPYLRDNTYVDVAYDSVWDVYYAKAESSMLKPSSVKHTLRDMDKVTEKLVNIAEDVFNTELRREIK